MYWCSWFRYIIIDEYKYEINPNKTPVEIIKEGAFGGTYFRDIYFCMNEKWYQNSWKEFKLSEKLCTMGFYDVSINEYGVECSLSLRTWEKNNWIRPMDPYGSFQWYCRYYDGRSCGDDLRQIMRWNNINIFKVLLIHKIVKSGCGYNDFSVSAKFR